MRMKTLLTLFATLLLCIATTSPAFAITSYTFNYPQFNSANVSYQTLSEPTTSISFQILNKLTFNASATDSVILKIVNGTTGTIYGVAFGFTKAGVLYISSVMPDWITLGESTWTTNDTINVIIKSNGDLIVKKGTTTILKDYNVGNFTMRALAANGAPYTCINGYLTVKTGANAMDDEIVVQWLPTIISLAMLGMVIGLLKKLSG